MLLIETDIYPTHIRLAVSHGVESLCGGRGRNREGIAKTRSQQLSRDRTDKAVHSDKRELSARNQEIGPRDRETKSGEVRKSERYWANESAEQIRLRGSWNLKCLRDQFEGGDD
jgi:hypothetical protein